MRKGCSYRQGLQRRALAWQGPMRPVRSQAYSPGQFQRSARAQPQGPVRLERRALAQQAQRQQALAGWWMPQEHSLAPVRAQAVWIAGAEGRRRMMECGCGCRRFCLRETRLSKQGKGGCQNNRTLQKTTKKPHIRHTGMNAEGHCASPIRNQGKSLALLSDMADARAGSRDSYTLN